MTVKEQPNAFPLPSHAAKLDQPLPPTHEVVRPEGRSKATLETARNRLVFTAILFFACFSLVGIRLLNLGLTGEVTEPRAAASGERGPVAARADIVDRNGTLLATTLPTASLYANPQKVSDPKADAKRLAALLPGLNEASLAAKLASDRRFVWVKRNLTPREHYDVNRLGLPGLYFQREDRRFYPQGALTAHLVGFTDIDNRGQAGIERSFDERISQNNKPLRLSIDLRLQHLLTDELAHSMNRFSGIGAAGVVLDSATGEVLAMASLPNFDPANPSLAEDDARFNRATLGVYEMGSVFKIFTTALALDRGIVGLSDGYDTSDPIRVARFTIRDYKPKKRWQSIPEIFIHSSNIGTVHMAMAAGTKAQQDFLQNLGLLQASPVELTEIGYPQSPSPWREINTMTISYGHGLSVSPIQLTSAVSAVVNGGFYRAPTLLLAEGNERRIERQVISQETSEVMRRLMRLVVTNGTGRQANAKGYLVGGKTGTAEKLGAAGYREDSRIATFVGAFPMKNPRYVIFTMVDEPKGLKETYGYATGGWVAAPVVGRLVERMAPVLGLPPLDDGGEEDDRNQLLLETAARGEEQAHATQ